MSSMTLTFRSLRLEEPTAKDFMKLYFFHQAIVTAAFFRLVGTRDEVRECVRNRVQLVYGSIAEFRVPYPFNPVSGNIFEILLSYSKPVCRAHADWAFAFYQALNETDKKSFSNIPESRTKDTSKEATLRSIWVKIINDATANPSATSLSEHTISQLPTDGTCVASEQPATSPFLLDTGAGFRIGSAGAGAGAGAGAEEIGLGRYRHLRQSSIPTPTPPYHHVLTTTTSYVGICKELRQRWRRFCN